LWERDPAPGERDLAPWEGVYPGEGVYENGPGAGEGPGDAVGKLAGAAAAPAPARAGDTACVLGCRSVSPPLLPSAALTPVAGGEDTPTLPGELWKSAEAPKLVLGAAAVLEEEEAARVWDGGNAGEM